MYTEIGINITNILNYMMLSSYKQIFCIILNIALEIIFSRRLWFISYWRNVLTKFLKDSVGCEANLLFVK